MNRIESSFVELPPPSWLQAMEEYILHVLDFLERDAWDLSILLCNDRFIQDLNARYRGMDESTDVLSFPLGETFLDPELGKRYIAGDLVISLDTLGENSKFFKVSEDEELRRLLVHGILHLDGMDHASNDTKEAMLVLQEKIITELSGEHIL